MANCKTLRVMLLSHRNIFCLAILIISALNVSFLRSFDLNGFEQITNIPNSKSKSYDKHLVSK